MKIIFSLIFAFCTFHSFGQNSPAISVMDFVKIKNNNRPEALYFYENNRMLYREIALKKEFIISYRILTTTPDSAAYFDLILITEYADNTNFNFGEERFYQRGAAEWYSFI